MTSDRCTVDVGNSSIGVGCWSGGQLLVERFDEPRAAAAHLGRSLGGRGAVVSVVAVVSVAPARLALLLAALPVEQAQRVQVLTRPPADLGAPELLSSAGADRIAVVLAVRPGPAIVVDAGTAVTVELIDANGRYLGGFIGPGPGASAGGLAAAAAQLPCLRGERSSIVPGGETHAALSAGVWGMAVGGVDRLVDAARAALPTVPVPRLVVTGGWGAGWAADSRHRDVHVDADLVHRGIARWAGWGLDR